MPAGTPTLLDRARTGRARARASRPKRLLPDEIAGGLTDEEGGKPAARIRAIRARGVTIVRIAPVLHALLAVADRLKVPNLGEKSAGGLPAAVIADPEVKRLDGDRGMTAPLRATRGLIARSGGARAPCGIDMPVHAGEAEALIGAKGRASPRRPGR